MDFVHVSAWMRELKVAHNTLFYYKDNSIKLSQKDRILTLKGNLEVTLRSSSPPSAAASGFMDGVLHLMDHLRAHPVCARSTPFPAAKRACHR